MEIQISEEEMRGFCAIDVGEDGCLRSLRKELEETEDNCRGADPRTIFRVPESIRAADPDAYQPKIISFGPYHRGQPHLQDMEKNKRIYLKRILSRNPNTRLDDYYEEMKRLEAQARSSYSEEIQMKSEEFIKMLLLDGCFIIQLLLTLSRRREQHATAMTELEDKEEEEHQRLLTQNKEKEEEEEEEDYVIDKPWALALVGTDMLRLENQLPFFILQPLFRLATEIDHGEGEAKPTNTLPNMALDFFYDLLPSKERSLETESHPEFHHLLHLFHWGIEPSVPAPPRSLNGCSWLCHCCKRPPTHSIDPESVPCATELQAAGVNFKKNQEGNSLLDVDFHYNCLILGALRFTPLPIYDQTEDIFRNFIALEQCSPGVGSHVTTYAVFMDCIIDTPADVALLHRRGMVMNGLGNDEDAAAMFNGLCKGVAFDLERSYLSGLFRDVTRHCEKRANRWRATLVRDYFSSPWSCLSLVGALIILSLTVVQTSFAIRAYYHPPPPS